MKRVAILGIIFLLPLSVHAQTASSTLELQAFISQLKTQIMSLQEMVSELERSLKAKDNELEIIKKKISIERTLRRGMSGDDVRALQEFLALDNSIYPEAIITGYFGTLTEAAVKRFQAKLSIVMTGDPNTTGFGQVGPLTATKLKETLNESNSYSGGTSTSMNSTNSTSTSGSNPTIVPLTQTVIELVSSTSTTMPSTSNTPTGSSGVSPTSTTGTGPTSGGGTSSSTNSSPAGSSSNGSSGSSSSSSASSTPDTTAPIVSIASPANGATVSGVISVTADASDNIGVTGVQFKLDGSTLSSEDTNAPYNSSWTTTSSTNGSHTLSAVARDAAGNTTVSPSITVTVSNTSASSVDFGISGVENLSPTMTAGAPASIAIQPYLYECISCTTSPATTIVAFYTQYYPNDPPYNFEWIMTNAPRYGEQTITVPPLTLRAQTFVQWTGTMPAAGHYMFVAKIDPSNSESETNENNNGLGSEFYTQ